MFRLIKSMSKGDRRNFKLFARLQEGDKQYIRLFDAIDKQTEYDEPELLAQFKGEKFTNQFSVAKNYLYNYILKTLHIFRKDPKTELDTILHQVQILISKNLFEQAQKQLRKARHMAQRQERFHEMLYVLSTDRYLLFRRHQIKEFEAFIEQIQQDEQQNLARLTNLQEYEHIYDSLYRIMKSSLSARDSEGSNKIKKILANPLVANAEKAMSVRAQLQRFDILFDAYRMLDDWASCRNVLAQSIPVFETNADIRKEKSLSFIRSISNLGIIQFQLGDINGAIETVNQLKTVKCQTDEAANYVFEKYYQLKIALCQEVGDIPEGMRVISEFEKALVGLKGKLMKSYEYHIYFNIASFLIFAGSPNDALGWINRILNEPKTEIRTDILAMTRVINLIVHYNLGNRDYLEYDIKSAVRFLSNRERLFSFERIILKNLRSLANLAPDADVQIALERFRLDMQEVVKDPMERKGLAMFDIFNWIEAEKRGLPMYQVKSDSDAISKIKQ